MKATIYIWHIYIYLQQITKLVFLFFLFFLPFSFKGSCSSRPEHTATKHHRAKTTDMEMQRQGGLCKLSKALSAIGSWAVIIHGTSVCSYLL